MDNRKLQVQVILTAPCPACRQLLRGRQARTSRRCLEPIPKMSQGLAERDERAGEVEEAEVVGADSSPAHERPAEAVVQGVGPLHDPSARLALDAAQERLLADAPDAA